MLQYQLQVTIYQIDKHQFHTTTSAGNKLRNERTSGSESVTWGPPSTIS